MPIHPANTSSAEAARPRRSHDDAPDTTALFTRLAALPDGPERDALRAELTTVWLPMAHRIAGRFRDRGENVEDLRQVAALGLVKAIDRFDPGRGAFESYAVPTITGEVKRHFRDRTWALRVPRRVQELRKRVRVARRDLTDRPGGQAPSVAGIAGHTGLTEAEVTAGLEALDSYTTLSLDAQPAGEGSTLTDSLGAPDPAYSVVVDREAARRSLGRLPERDRDILYMRFFEDLSQSRIAARLGISQMHVSRLLHHICARVRDEVQDPRADGPLKR
ncbi:SigB/SigF/SigG family RNA polymerase sigma factor [Streptomyces griseoluteus]|uniref:SigB/SigF/SigG family RNA polymerase sigma factor n=1 Tax=Streptomyces griseoluteus TaxID=29306 RepID=A0A4Z1D147_STRGP|nr:SigB/SigF/SigG family RNA polymerase sigma factor [Streptomyces griseoluteus]TGN75144.1 SigB/SigF/SigG family RNA polymerase sigma factor [Streptomyces griseoluteus]GHF34065.1 RNA polymerase sigma factor [Streptomyces griseoluteus]